MSRPLRRILALFGLLALGLLGPAGPGAAESPAGPEDFHALVRWARARAPAWQDALWDWETALSEYRQALAELGLDLELEATPLNTSAGSPRQPGSEGLDLPGASVPATLPLAGGWSLTAEGGLSLSLEGEPPSPQASFSLSGPLPGRRDLGREQADQRLAEARQRRDEEWRALVRAVADRLFAAAAAERELALATTRAELARAEWDRLRRQWESGLASGRELAEGRRDVLEAEQALADARLQRLQARSDLIRTLGGDPWGGAGLTGDRLLELAATVAPPVPAGDLPALVQEALSRRPEPQQARRILALRAAEWEQARRQAGWQTGFVTTWQSGAGEGPAGWSARLTVTLPLYGPPGEEEVRRAEIALERARRQVERAEEDVRAELQAAWDQWDSLRRQEALRAQSADEARESLAVAARRAELGLASDLDLAHARLAAREAEAALAEVQQQARAARLRLLHAAGNDWPSFGDDPGQEASPRDGNS